MFLSVIEYLRDSFKTSFIRNFYHLEAKVERLKQVSERIIRHGTTDPAGDKEVDVQAYPTAKRLVAACEKFFSEIDSL